MTDFFDKAMEDMDAHKADDEAEVNADEWEPTSEGQMLRGVFLKAIRKVTSYGVGYNVLVKDTDTGYVVKVWCKRSMLKGQLLEASPKPGKLVVFKYNGKHMGSNGYEYHAYQVRAEEMDPAYWAKITKPTEEELRPTPQPAVPSFSDDEVPY